MKILLIRHGKAEEREAFSKKGQSDHYRPLTKAGCRQVRKAARGLRSLIPKIDLLASSNLTRAAQTAEIIADSFEGTKPIALRELGMRKDPASLLRAVISRREDGVVALVGHEPDLGAFAGWLLTGLHESFIPFGKSGAALIEFDETPAAGRGKLHWVLRASQLKQLR